MSDTPQHPRTFTASPFARLAAAQAVSMVGDACITVSLAGSLFFTADPGSSRTKVLQYLLISFAPFVVVAPIIGPLLDRSRGGRRTLMAIGFAGRAVLCLLMARHLTGLLLYPLAFGVLILSKGHTVAKSSLVPAVVDREDELYRANSRLAVISVLGGAAGGLPAVIVLRLFGAQYALLMAMCFFAAGVPLAMRIPKAKKVAVEESAQQLEELHVPSIVRAGTAMSVLRAGVGFLTFLLAFALKEAKEPAWVYGLVIAAAGVGQFAGVIAGPFLRRRYREELILGASLLIPGVVALFGARDVGRFSELFVTFMVAIGSGAARVGFDSLLQRDGPDEVRGRAFARFETRFQLVWVVGALIPVAIPTSVMSPRLGLFLLAIGFGFAGLWYLGGLRGSHLREPKPPRHRPSAGAVEPPGSPPPPSAPPSPPAATEPEPFPGGS